jgi:acetylornithine deacetylase/succinyl-diaminopimelate desuccinylase-like protein
LSEAIRLRTVNPPGDEAPLAARLVEELRRGGIEAEVIETPRGESEVGRAAAWGILPGRGGRAPVVLLSHLDVVPAESPAWRVDPFAGAREQGFVVGRGAQDAKGVAVVQLLTLVELARRGIALERDVVFLATPDEETGGHDGAGWLLRERRDLLRDARYVLTEGGGVRIGARGRAIWQVAVTEKIPCWLRILAEGEPGHSSVPPPGAAVPRLLDALDRLRRLEPDFRITPEVARMFAAMAGAAPAADAEGFAALSERIASDPEFRRRLLAEPAYAALLRDTFTITVLQGSPRTNVLAERAEAHVDARLLPGGSCDAFAKRVREAVDRPGVRVETLLAFPSHQASPVDTHLFRAIEVVAEATQPGALVVPRVVPGFTDAHWFREAGLVAYGFVPRWNQPPEDRGVHGPNERISVENLERGVETLIAILEELDRQELAPPVRDAVPGG